jgi:hypothetical protein
MLRLLLFIILFVNLTTSNAQSGNRQVFWSLNHNPSNPPPSGDNIPFSFTEQNYATSTIQNPGMGAEQWHNGSQAINYPTANTLVQPWDVYYRFQWVDIEPESQGVYNWSYFDGLMQEAVNSGKQFSFGIMSVYSGDGKKFYDGHSSAYPKYLHDLMQAESANSRDWVGPQNDWIPNYNSPNYISRLRALHTAINNHIMNTSYVANGGPHNGKTIQGRDVIYCIDIRGYGQWGEWNTYDIADWNAFPSGRQPSIASLKAIIDAHTEIFTDFPLVMMVAAYDGGKTGIPIFAPSPELAWYALNASNNWGPSGWRRDQWGATDPYLNTLLVGNDKRYEISPGVFSPPFNTVILAKYQTSPITGEVYPGQAGFDNLVNLESQIITYGATSVGNGNWGQFPNSTGQLNIRNAFKRTGYRVRITNGTAPQLITRNVQFTIEANWINTGICPPYNNWVVQYELQDGSNNVVWTGTSSKVLKRFQPSATPTLTSDNFTVPNSVSAGTYKLVVRVRDDVGYRPNMKLFVSNAQNADGSYTIFNSVTVN